MFNAYIVIYFQIVCYYAFKSLLIVIFPSDAAIQKTVRTEFANATCLTVAHRLNTILDSDRVLVMSDGVAAEFDTPQNLLTDESSVFYSLVNSNNSSNNSNNENHSSRGQS